MGHVWGIILDLAGKMREVARRAPGCGLRPAKERSNKWRRHSEVKQELRRQWIETPSWAYGNTGTRFKVFRNPAAAHDPLRRSKTPLLCTG